MTYFKIIVVIMMFQALSYGPDPCPLPQSYTGSLDTVVVFEDTCRQCAMTVYEQAMDQQMILQLGTTQDFVTSHWANVIISVKLDSVCN